jgi:hypothetical protein
MPYSSLRVPLAGPLEAVDVCSRCARLGSQCMVDAGARVCVSCRGAKARCFSKRSRDVTNRRYRERLRALQTAITDVLSVLDSVDLRAGLSLCLCCFPYVCANACFVASPDSDPSGISRESVSVSASLLPDRNLSLANGTASDSASVFRGASTIFADTSLLAPIANSDFSIPSSSVDAGVDATADNSLTSNSFVGAGIGATANSSSDSRSLEFVPISSSLTVDSDLPSLAVADWSDSEALG